MKHIFTLLLAFFLSLDPLFANFSDFRMRARETFEVYNFKFESEDKTYKGLSNTFNLWYEKPFRFSFGLAGGALLSSFESSKKQAINGISDKIKIDFLGIEFKYFLIQLKNKGLFVRPGVYWHNLKTNSSRGDIYGRSFYTGIGYEFLVYKGLSLAPELGFKAGKTREITWTNFNASIGLHFYK